MEKTRLTLRLPPDLAEQAAAVAEHQGLTVNAFIVQAVRNWRWSQYCSDFQLANYVRCAQLGAFEDSSQLHCMSSGLPRKVTTSFCDGPAIDYAACQTVSHRARVQSSPLSLIAVAVLRCSPWKKLSSRRSIPVQFSPRTLYRHCGTRNVLYRFPYEVEKTIHIQTAATP